MRNGGISFGENRCNLPSKLWYSVPDYIPHELIINAEIVMNEPVTHSSHSTPLNARVLGSKTIRDFLSRFSDDFKAPDEGASKCFVSQKLLDSQTSGLAYQVIYFD
jgi:hypothetical protein